MNATVKPPKCCQQPCDCAPGDWVSLQDVPDWPHDAETHAYVLPGQVMVQPMQQVLASIPLVSWHFRRGTATDGSGAEVAAWFRER